MPQVNEDEIYAQILGEWAEVNEVLPPKRDRRGIDGKTAEEREAEKSPLPLKWKLVLTLSILFFAVMVMLLNPSIGKPLLIMESILIGVMWILWSIK